ncbi:LytR/AlgR family response regulator transcription factor [Algoriphagus litoralis]|uniref:LytR/AlgR family response regulator transcription factor n=1 Tax=Algoriphagus litoralis TaxID=2202829 RepID=UPI000DB9B65D|nr:LytTR family DNA-binding domain-containing protein [Algoriphagus litoralis]
MIQVIILEDEIPAQKKILKIIQDLALAVNVVATLDSVQSGKAFFSSSRKIDLIISDIELRDGNAFEIFEEIAIPCPIIFTTAYNQFWMQAFETNGIAYLLKPFGVEKFKLAWDKFIRLTQQPEDQVILLQQLRQLVSGYQSDQVSAKTFKTRLSVPNSRGNYFLEIADMVYFYADQGVIFGVDHAGKKHLLKEETLKELEDQLDPSHFFRINRSQLIQKSYVLTTERYSKSSVALKLKGIQEHLICSQSQTPVFLAWIEQ